MSPAQVSAAAGLVSAVNLIFWLLQLLVLARVVLSWVPVYRYHPVGRFIYNATEPMLRPLRSVVRVGGGGIDFAPLILLLLLWAAPRIIVGLVVGAIR
jgi:YggT family protein